MKDPNDLAVCPTRRTLVLASAIPFVLVWVLYLLSVPFGRSGVLVYHYSPLAMRRFVSVLVAFVIFAIAGFVFRRLGRTGKSPRSIVGVFALFAVGFLGVWTHLAPPAPVTQHFFALRSLAQEGAFVIEAATIESLDDYLAGFPDSLARTVEEMRGARVLSNPPGVTIVAFWCDRILRAAPGLASGLINIHGGDFAPQSPQGLAFAQAMMLSWLFTLTWVAAAPVLYALARIWLDPLPAVLIALICWFNPSTVNFSPGKDPAQLFTIAASLYGFFGGVIQGRRLLGFLGGVAFVVGLAFGLIHAWIALIAVSAALWAFRRDPNAMRKAALCALLPGAAGVALMIFAVWIVWGWNMPATLLAVAASYYRSADIPPWIWNLAKPPMFGLFAGAGVWALIVAVLIGPRAADDPARLGRSLGWITAGAILFVCPSSALETPRLWMAFLPTLVLGLALCLPFLRTGTEKSDNAIRLVIVLQVVTTCLHWCLFDVRESEMRLLTGRLFE